MSGVIETQPQPAETTTGTRISPARGKLRVVLSITCFLVCACALVCLLSTLFTPRFNNVRGAVRGMYDQPRDSVEVLFVGASTFHEGISPVYLYEHFGISSYDYGTGNQPTMASYYLILDALRTQSGSLKTIVLDVSPILNNGDRLKQSSWPEQLAMVMDPSPVRLEFSWALAREYDDIDFLEQLIPAMRFHERWQSLTKGDFEKVYSRIYTTYSHGQETTPLSNVAQGRGEQYTDEWNLSITNSIEKEGGRLKAVWNPNGVRWLEKIVELCNERGIHLLLLKTPASNWGDSPHDSATILARDYGIDFFDMSEPQTWTQSGLAYSTDYRDAIHANTLGSLKISEWIGRYLVEHYDLTDVRGDERFAHFERDAAQYALDVEDARLLPCTDFVEYLSMLDRDRYTVFVVTSGEAAAGLTDEARSHLRELGLSGLADLRDGESYAAVLDAGSLLAQKTSTSGAPVTIDGSYENGRAVILPEEQTMQPNATFDTPFSICGTAIEDGGSVSVSGERVSETGRGILFVVYRRDTEKLIDTSLFDTHENCARMSDLPPQNNG